VAGIQHAKGASNKDESDDNRNGIDDIQEWQKAWQQTGKLESPLCTPPSEKRPTVFARV
jgi:hypothetical protein